MGIWCAVSSKPQAGDDKSSLAEQEAAGRAFAQAIGGQVVAVYSVPGHTRDYWSWHEAEQDVPAYRQAREDLQSDRLDVIHAVDADRLGRDAALVAQFVSLAQRHGAEVYLASMPHPVGHFSTGHRYLHALAGVRADEDNALRTRRMKAGMRSRVARRGLFASNPPLGYAPVLDELGRVTGYRHDHHAETIRAITRLFLDGANYVEITRRMNASGLSHPNRPGRPWCYATIWNILHNDGYAGLPTWGPARPDEPSPHIEPIWNASTFAAVVAQRKRQTHGYSRRGSGPLTGVAYCARCDSPMTRVLNHGAFYLRCGTHAHPRAGPRPCHANYIKEALALAYLGGYLARFLTPDDIAAALAEAQTGPAAEALAADLHTARAAAVAVTAQRERIALAYAAGRMTDDIYRATDDTLLARLHAEQRRASDLEQQIAAVPDLAARAAALSEIVSDFTQLIAGTEPAAVAHRLQTAGLRVYIEDHQCTRVSLC